MSTKILNRLAAGVSVVIILGWGAYWIVQIQDVLDLLALASGQ